jgi:CRP-like cAMP-binding protein
MSISGLFPIDNYSYHSDSIFLGLPPDDLQLFHSLQYDQRYPKGQVVFKEGALAAGIFYIKTGRVKKYKTTNGGEQILCVANAGELIGYHTVLSDDHYPDSAATLESSLISFIPKEGFLKLLGNSPLLTSRLLRLLSHEFTVFANHLTHFSQRSVRERLALQLVILRERYKTGPQPDLPIGIDLSREDLANLVGTARENIIRILADFKDEGIVATKGRKIFVLDLKKLIAVSHFK